MMAQKTNKPKLKRPQWISKISAAQALTAIVVAWFLFGFFLLGYPNFQWLFPGLKVPLFGQAPVVLFVIFLAIVAGFKFSPKEEPVPDLPRAWARSWFFFFLAAGAFLRLYHPHTASVTYWDDYAEDIIASFNIVDFKDFPFIISYGTREPFFYYFTALFHFLLPGETAVFIQRLSLTLISLLTLWVGYLLGKEVGGRRVGVLLTALMAVSKPAILLCLTGMRMGSVVLGVAVALLFFFRLLRKPDFAHFIQWSLALSFGIYTYASYRPFVPFFIFAVLAWALFHERWKDLDTRGRAFLGATAVCLLVYFLYTNGYWPWEQRLTRILRQSGLWLPGMVLALLFVLLVRFLSIAENLKKHPKIIGWTAGTFTCTFLTVAVMQNQNILDRLKPLSITGQFQGWQFIGKFLEKWLVTFRSLFAGGWNRPDLAIPEDSFFDFSSTLLIFLGLAFWIARPGWKKNMLALSALVGVSTHLLSSDPHSGKQLASVAPFLLIAALGLDGLWKTVKGFPRAGWLRWAVAALFLVFWVWSARMNFLRCYDQYAEKNYTRESVVAQQAMKDAGEYLVYIAGPEAGTEVLYTGPTLSVLLEGKPVRMLYPNNPVCPAAGETRKDIVVLLIPNAEDLKRKIRAQYPTAQWSEVKRPPMSRYAVTYVLRVQIPSGAVSKNKSQLFTLRDAPEGAWKRTYYFGHMGLTRGFIQWEDQTGNLNEPPSAGFDLLRVSARFTGHTRVEETGPYRISFQSPNYVVLSIDGKKVLDERPDEFEAPRNGMKTVRLQAGDHRMECLTYFLNNREVPELWITKKGEGEEKKRPLWPASK